MFGKILLFPFSWTLGNFLGTFISFYESVTERDGRRIVRQLPAIVTAALTAGVFVWAYGVFVFGGGYPKSFAAMKEFGLFASETMADNTAVSFYRMPLVLTAGGLTLLHLLLTTVFYMTDEENVFLRILSGVTFLIGFLFMPSMVFIAYYEEAKYGIAFGEAGVIGTLMSLVRSVFGRRVQTNDWPVAVFFITMFFLGISWIIMCIRSPESRARLSRVFALLILYVGIGPLILLAMEYFLVFLGLAVVTVVATLFGGSALEGIAASAEASANAADADRLRKEGREEMRKAAQGGWFDYAHENAAKEKFREADRIDPRLRK